MERYNNIISRINKTYDLVEYKNLSEEEKKELVLVLPENSIAKDIIER